MDLKFEHASETPGRLIIIQISGSHLRVSHLVGSGWALAFSSSNKFPGDADATELGTIL